MNRVLRRVLACDPGAVAVLKLLRQSGYEAYLVGGCVRDSLLGRTPKDWDIATNAVPDAIEALFPRTVAVGKAFGVMVVVTAAGAYEVATFRGDGAYSDGRRPDQVVFSGPEEDVRRRDFTLNALLYDPLSEQVLDFVGGVADMEAGILRTVGDPRERFREDRLRLLRAIRFAAWTGFAIEPQTRAAIEAQAETVAGVSAERIGEELTRMLTEGASRRSFELLEQTGLLRVVLPEAAAMRGVEQPPEFHPEGDVWVHTLCMLGVWDDRVVRLPGECPPGLTGAPAEREILGWALLLHDVAKPATFAREDRIRFHGHDALGAAASEAILRRLRRPKRVLRAVSLLVGRHMRFVHLRDMRQAKRRRFVADEFFPLHLELHRIDCLGSHGKLDAYEAALEFYRQEQARPIPLEPLLRGDDLLAAGYREGPLLGRTLRAVGDARLEGRVTTPEEALAWARRHYPPESKPPEDSPEP
ncbi:MAG: CCA tRNA nucleotidyltransferase [Lentisphaeria bacterium]|nr:CCA tRNA nucleotidyltransferase [Lentisphaeria bacterium]